MLGLLDVALGGGLWGRWAVGLQDSSAVGLQEYWAVGMLGFRDWWPDARLWDCRATDTHVWMRVYWCAWLWDFWDAELGDYEAAERWASGNAGLEGCGSHPRLGCRAAGLDAGLRVGGEVGMLSCWAGCRAVGMLG